MRRLPVYFLIDVSESMVGEPIDQVQEGMGTVIRELKTDPVALETVWISIIGFAGKSKVITPLQDVITFYPPKFPIGSGTSLSSGLTELMCAMDRELVTTTYQQKGDWKPIIFLFTDGVPTDDSVDAISKWQTKYSNKVNLIAISLSSNTNYELLGKLTPNVLHFQDTDAQAYKEFFRWVTASIKTTSEGVAHRTSDTLCLEKVNPDVMEKIDLGKSHQIVDENFVVLHAKCSTTEKSYLIKFKKEIEASGIMNLSTRIYQAQGAYKIDDKAYSEYSNTLTQHLKISTQELFGNPNCPCCVHQFSLASCACGKIHCVKGVGENACPWCGRVDFYGVSDGGFDITRTLG
ncbi:VWA domain-containing protein [Sphingobacterium sp. lm-10]|uniref:TerY-C metal binding domain-containing protein n=1 Tax=Sphingobacterium sp. lm-10 TaxID=2944904 RepID=UPI002020C012|nr:TerY-C metal binding domain-containing protein [Sphingobacterium sp. lm-10]MCL7987429.1 VWA domain-containing protein [Sphingobacterium sp. lm-10]